MRQGTNCGWPVGGDRFKREIAKALKCRVTPLPPGPKPQTPPDKHQMKLGIAENHASVVFMDGRDNGPAMTNLSWPK